MELEDLQAEYNVLEGSRDIFGRKHVRLSIKYTRCPLLKARGIYR